MLSYSKIIVYNVDKFPEKFVQLQGQEQTETGAKWPQGANQRCCQVQGRFGGFCRRLWSHDSSSSVSSGTLFHILLSRRRNKIPIPNRILKIIVTISLQNVLEKQNVKIVESFAGNAGIRKNNLHVKSFVRRDWILDIPREDCCMRLCVLCNANLVSGCLRCNLRLLLARLGWLPDPERGTGDFLSLFPDSQVCFLHWLVEGR